MQRISLKWYYDLIFKFLNTELYERFKRRWLRRYLFSKNAYNIQIRDWYLYIIIIIITLLKSQIILAKHKCSTNWGDCKSNQSNQINQINQIKSNQIKCWFLRRGENRSTRRKTSRSANSLQHRILRRSRLIVLHATHLPFPVWPLTWF